MKEFKIRKIDNEFSRFFVEIEFIESGDRRKFGYPIDEFWEEEVDGKPKFIKDIIRQVSEEEKKEVSFDLEKLKKYEGLKLSDKDIKKKPTPSLVDDKACKKG